MWIDVNDKFPDSYETVIGYNEKTTDYFICFYGNNGIWKDQYDMILESNITHWQEFKYFNQHNIIHSGS